MGFNLDSLNPFDNGHVLDLAGGGPGNTLKSAWDNFSGQNNTHVGTVSVDPSLSGTNGNPTLGAGNDYGLGDVWSQIQNQYAKLGSNAAAAVGPAQLQTSASDPFRAGQLALAGNLQNVINGTAGPSAADLQLQAGGQANLANALAVLGSQRGAGTNPALLARAATDAGAAAGAQTNQQAALLRAQEIQNAQGQLGNVLGTGNAQSQAQELAQAQLEQQANLANQSTQVQNAGLYNQGLNSLLGAESTIGQGNQNAALNVGTTNANLAAGANNANAGIAAQNAQANANAWGTVLKTVGSVGAVAASDERLKEDVHAANPMMDSFLRQFHAAGGDEDFAHAAKGVSGMTAMSDEDEKEDTKDADIGGMLDQLHAYSYRYKDPTLPGAGPGQHTGVMAQDLEKSPVGRQFVKETPVGKQVDYGQMGSVQLAASAYLNDRLDQHEKLFRALMERR